MTSFSFPNMLSVSNSNIIYDKDAIRSNIVALLSSECETLFGDPYFGTNIKNFIYEQNNVILRDLIIDDIFVKKWVCSPWEENVAQSDRPFSQNGIGLYVHFHEYYYIFI